MKIYTYVIMTDRGSAPNYEGLCTTLAICKPMIRKGAQVGDMVLAFTGSSLSSEPHGVCWAGLVSEKLSFAQYWCDKRFADKKPEVSLTPDNIYRPGESGLIHVPNSSHGPEAQATDTGGQFVLAFDPSWYFGIGGPILPEEFGLRMVSSRRGHRVHNTTPDLDQQLLTWLNSQTQAEITLPQLAQNDRHSVRQSCGSG